MRAALTVVKLGGSQAYAAHLRAWLAAIGKHAGRVVLVPGGGPFADTVREAQGKIGFDDRAAHGMALLAMEQYAWALAARRRRFILAATVAAIQRARRNGQVPVWLPSRMVLAAKKIPASWDITSDSLAAWLCGRLRAAQLLLVKHAVEQPGRSIDARSLAGKGIVDRAFPGFLRASGAACVILGAADHVVLGEVIDGSGGRGLRVDGRGSRR